MNLPRRDRVTGLARRSREVLVLAAATGALTGLAVAGFEWVTGQQALDRVYSLPVMAQAIAPGVGLVLAWSALRWMASGCGPSTSDE